MKTVSHIIHHMLFHFLSLWDYFNIFAKRKLDCCLYFINLLIWLKWLQANFKQAFPQGRHRRLWKERDKKEIIICVRSKRKWILIYFSAYQIYPIIYFMLSLFSWSCLILLSNQSFTSDKKAAVYWTWKGFIKILKTITMILNYFFFFSFSFHSKINTL